MNTSVVEAQPLPAIGVEPPLEFAVVVTPRHIAAGHRKTGESCPLTLAIRDLLGECDYVSEQGHAIVRQRPYGADGASEFVGAFDRGDQVHPERFVFRRWSWGGEDLPSDSRSVG
jgi:hypothetical protein